MKLLGSPSNTFFPWNGLRHAPTRWIAQTLAFLLVSAIIYSLVGRYMGPEYVFPITPEEHISLADLPLETWKLGITAYTNQAFVFLLSYGLNAGLNLAEWPQYVQFTLALLSLGTLAALVTYFSPTWFYLSLAAMAVGFSTLPIAVLTLPSLSTQSALVGVCLAVGLACFYLYRYQQRWPFGWRWLLTTAVVGLCMGLVTWNLPFEERARAFNAYFTTTPVVVAVIFIFIVSASIPASVFYVLTENKNLTARKNTLPYFLFFTVPYLVYVLLTYLHMRGTIEVNILHIDFHYLLIVSTLVGTFSFARNVRAYSNVVPYAPAGALLFLTLGVTCFGVLGYHWFEMNDGVLEALEDAVLLGHFCFGAMYVLYALINFLELFPTSARIHTVFYEGKHMPHSALIAAPLTGIGVFALTANLIMVKQVQHSYYNSIGTSYFVQKEYNYASQYYERAKAEYMVGHKNNYIHALSELRQGHLREARDAVEYGVFKTSLPQTYLLGNYLAKLTYDLPAAFAFLRQGINNLEDDGALLTSLSHLYFLTSQPDSALHTAQLVTADKAYANLARENVLASAAKLGTDLPDAGTEVSANWLAYQHMHGKAPKEALVPDTALPIPAFCRLFNQAVANARQGDSTGVATITQVLASQSNQTFASDLHYAAAILQYYGGDKRQALTGISHLAQLEEDRAKRYAYTGAHWHAQQHLHERAAGMFHAAGSLYSTALQDAEMENLLWAGVFDRQVALMADSLKSIAAQRTPQQRQLMAAFYNQPIGDTGRYYQAIWLAASGREAQAVSSASTLAPAFQVPVAQLATRLAAWRGTSVPVGAQDAESQVYAQLADTAAMPSWNNSWKLAPWRQGLKTYVDARADKDPVSALMKYQLALAQLPGDELVLRDALALANRQKQVDLGYQLALDATDANPRSVHLQEMYIAQAEYAGLSMYADQGRERLRTMMSPAQYAAWLARHPASTTNTAPTAAAPEPATSASAISVTR